MERTDTDYLAKIMKAIPYLVSKVKNQMMMYLLRYTGEQYLAETKKLSNT